MYLDSGTKKHAVGINNGAVLTTAMGIIGSVAFIFT